MKYVVIFMTAALVVLAIAYVLLSQKTVEAPVATDEETVTPAAPTPEEAAAQPSELPPPTNYIGLSEADAEELAGENGAPFRVVERDGEALMVTEDWRPGRINAVVEGGVVVSYTVEGSEQSSALDKGDSVPTGGPHDAIIGMTEIDAEAYAATNEVLFRIGAVDGQALPVTMDYRPGRITASIVDGVVTEYTVE